MIVSRSGSSGSFCLRMEPESSSLRMATNIHLVSCGHFRCMSLQIRERGWEADKELDWQFLAHSTYTMPNTSVRSRHKLHAYLLVFLHTYEFSKKLRSVVPASVFQETFYFEKKVTFHWGEKEKYVENGVPTWWKTDQNCRCECLTGFGKGWGGKEPWYWCGIERIPPTDQDF